MSQLLPRVLGRFGGGLEQPDLRGVVALPRGLGGPGPAAGDVVDGARRASLLGLVLLALDLGAQRVEARLLAGLERREQALPRLLLVGAVVLAWGGARAAPVGGELGGRTQAAGHAASLASVQQVREILVQSTSARRARGGAAEACVPAYGPCAPPSSRHTTARRNRGRFKPRRPTA